MIRSEAEKPRFCILNKTKKNKKCLTISFLYAIILSKKNKMIKLKVFYA